MEGHGHWQVINLIVYPFSYAIFSVRSSSPQRRQLHSYSCHPIIYIFPKKSFFSPQNVTGIVTFLIKRWNCFWQKSNFNAFIYTQKIKTTKLIGFTIQIKTGTHLKNKQNNNNVNIATWFCYMCILSLHKSLFCL